MKLNIGCGKKFEPDYYNIDLYDNLVSDKIMSAFDLEISNNSSEEIKAIHLIEHLGFYQSIYALSEFFRVLEPNGKLILETPDLEKAFRAYLGSNYEQKKDILRWIYGLPHEGLEHKFCFPPKLLKEILEKIGFEKIIQTNFYNHESIPSVRLTCNKPEHNNYLNIFQIFSSIRKRMLSEKIVNFKNLFLTKEQEDLLNFLLIETLKVRNNKNKDYKFIDKALIQSPQIVKIYLTEMLSKNYAFKIERNHILEVVEYLIKFKLQTILYNLLKNAPIIPGSQKVIFSSIESYGRAFIDKFLHDKIEKSKIINDLNQLCESIKQENISFFSTNIVKRDSLDYFYRGIKEYHNKNYTQSLGLFLNAIKLYRDDFLYFWNLAKVFAKLNSKQKAIRYYKKTLKLLSITSLQNKVQIRKDIKLELNWIKNRKENLIQLKPILSLEKYQLNKTP
ncbi:MAG: methyltransferase domain-containing protein [Promethearchaeota archaeon]